MMYDYYPNSHKIKKGAFLGFTAPTIKYIDYSMEMINKLSYQILARIKCILTKLSLCFITFKAEKHLQNYGKHRERQI